MTLNPKASYPERPARGGDGGQVSLPARSQDYVTDRNEEDRGHEMGRHRRQKLRLDRRQLWGVKLR